MLTKKHMVQREWRKLWGRIELKKKKPTKNDIETVINNIIMELQTLRAGIGGLDVAITEYIKYKKDEKGFQEHVDAKLKQQEDEKQSK